MADKLFNTTTAVITNADTVTWTHGLVAAGVQVVPDILIPVSINGASSGSAFRIVSSTTATVVVAADLVNAGGPNGTVRLTAEYLHSIQRVT